MGTMIDLIIGRLVRYTNYDEVLYHKLIIAKNLKLWTDSVSQK